MDATSDSEVADGRDDHKLEVQITSGARPHLSIPKSWNTSKDPNAPLASGADTAKSRKSMQVDDMTEALPQPRGRKRKALTEEERQRSNLMRRLGACDSCRKRKLACSPSHDRGDGGHTLRLALATYQMSGKAIDVAPRSARRFGSAGPEAISDSTATSVHDEPLGIKLIDKARISSIRADRRSALEKAEHSAAQGVTFSTEPSSIADPEIRTRHADLQKFGQALNNATSSVFPATSHSKYSSAHVLLLRWQEDDLGVSDEAEALAEVFAEQYHFEVSVGLIPSDSPSRWLSRKILNFIEVDDDSHQTLKIVWYGGHSFISESKQCMWANDCHFTSTVSWQGCQSLLEEARSDVLILLDACGSGNSNTSAGDGLTEVITAGGWYGGALPEVGPFSFTSTLTTELRLLSSREYFSIDQLYQHMLARIQSQLSSDNEKRRHPTPYHTISRKDTSFGQSITLCPLSDMQTRRGPDNSRPTSRRHRTTSAGLMGSEALNPGMALWIRLKDSYNASQLSTDQFLEWLRAIPIPAEQIQVEAGYANL
ncbi:uncharacterized protein PAC_11669 [Phialocephala subalpina]|uniref:Uncharacterized protein n=1 Tax=Phialocephala subalpina TaxID=576137 RepID=A0A1L7X9T4_9HELO|nr:uncharacterized protein PAC_11669 [Phialocephala subalpina]